MNFSSGVGGSHTKNHVPLGSVKHKSYRYQMIAQHMEWNNSYRTGHPRYKQEKRRRGKKARNYSLVTGIQ